MKWLIAWATNVRLNGPWEGHVTWLTRIKNVANQVATNILMVVSRASSRLTYNQLVSTIPIRFEKMSQNETKKRIHRTRWLCHKTNSHPKLRLKATVALHGQVIVSQGQSQDRVTFQVNHSQGSCVSSSLSTHDQVFSQYSRTSPSLCQGADQSQKQSQCTDKDNQKLETIPESVSCTSSQNSQDLNPN